MASIPAGTHLHSNHPPKSILKNPQKWRRKTSSKFSVLCQSIPTQSAPKPPPTTATPSLSEQLKPLSESFLSAKNPSPQSVRKPKSTWVNPTRPRPSVLSLQRHKRPGYTWNPHLKELRLLAKKLGETELSEDGFRVVLSELGEKPTKDNALLIMNLLKTWQKTHFFFNWLREQEDLAMDTIFYNVMMKSLRNGKQWEVLEELAMEMIEKGIQLDNVSYSTIITCAKRCNFFDKAIEWFERMYRTGLMPDEVTYSAILDVYAKLGKTEEVLSLYDRARADGWEPDAVTFSVLGKMYGEIGDYDGIQYVLQEMRGIGIKPNLIVYNTLLEAMGKAGKPGLARSLFDEMIRSGLQPNVITLTALIKIYGKARWARDAFELWEEIKSNNWPVDFILYNTLLSMCADLGREEEAEKLFDDMKKSELCKPDSWSYTAMLNIYCNGGEVEKAHEFFREMLGSGNKLNVMSFTCLIQCYGRAKRFDDVVEVFNIMVERGVRPDDRLCGCLLSVLTFSKNGEFGSVLICLEKANRRLVHFIDILDKEEATLDMVKEKFREILNESVVEVRRPYCNCLIDICCNRGLTKRAHELLYLGNLFGLYSNLNTKTEMEWSLNLRSLSVGAAFTAFEEWLRALIEGIEHNERLPKCFAIHTGVGGRKLSQGLADSLSLHLKKMGSPFQQSEERAGWFVAAREEVVLWVRSLDSKSLLATT